MSQAKVGEKVYQLPQDDPRSKVVVATIKKAMNKPDSLIQVLHSVQNLYGYLPVDVVKFIIQELRLPPSRVYGVVTFYHFFSMKPKGEHTCLVCTGTACYVKGAQRIIDEVGKAYGIKPGEVTKNNRLSLQTARCIGACGLAPAVVIDDNIVARVKPEEITATIEARIGGAR